MEGVQVHRRFRLFHPYGRGVDQQVPGFRVQGLQFGNLQVGSRKLLLEFVDQLARSLGGAVADPDPRGPGIGKSDQQRTGRPSGSQQGDPCLRDLNLQRLQRAQKASDVGVGPHQPPLVITDRVYSPHLLGERGNFIEEGEDRALVGDGDVDSGNVHRADAFNHPGNLLRSGGKGDIDGVDFQL